MDNATFDRLARLLAGGASRRQTLRAIIAAAFTGGAADELLAARKDRDKDKRKDGGKDRKDRGRTTNRGGGDGTSDRVSAQGKKDNKSKNKKKRKRKNKRKNDNGNNTGGNTCAGTPLRPGQDFVGCDFSGDNLRGKDLSSSSFTGVDLSDADLCGADLESTSFDESDLTDANLTDVTLDSSSHNETSFAGANLTGASLRVATFNEVDFSGADLTGADFTGATFADVDFSGAIFCRTVKPDGAVDDRDCDLCENACGFCEDCGEDCTPPTCCPNPEGPGGICVDTDTDPLNCGGCDRACFDNLANACVDGECVCGNEPECSGGETCCRGEGGNPTRCVDLDHDTLNCGECGRMCLVPTNPCLAVVCRDGTCEDIPVDDGSACVVNQQQGICCTSGGVSTCIPGDLGVACCTDTQCDATEACCENHCIDVQDDPNNCGGCGEACNPDVADACTDGACTCGSGSQCVEGDTCCNGQCVDTDNDVDNCGACGEVCTPSNSCHFPLCEFGACIDVPDFEGTPCAEDQEAGLCCAPDSSLICVVGAQCCSDSGSGCDVTENCCDNQCVNTNSDFNHCGICNNPCEQGKASECSNGQCVCGSEFECPETETCCPGTGGDQPSCINTNTDFDNCGGCGDPCFETADSCANGECVCGQLGFACPVGNVCCGGQCADIDSAFDHCGSCQACDSEVANDCVEGTCVCGENPACTEGFVCVEGACSAAS